MQIKTRLTIHTAASAAAALIIIVVFVSAVFIIGRANRRAMIASEIIVTTLERIALRNDYLGNDVAMTRDLWFSKQEQINRILKTASETFRSAGDRMTVDNLVRNQESTTKIFSAIVMNRDRKRTAPGGPWRETEHEMLDQMNMLTFESVVQSRALVDSNREARTEALRQAGTSILVVLLVALTTIIAGSQSIRRAITDRFRRLRDGASTIGAGDLGHRIDIAGDDEFSELAGAFNAMTTELRASHDRLAQENEDRKRAETALRESEQKFSLLFDKAGFGAALATSPDGVFIDVNEALLDMFGFSRQDVIGKNSLELGIYPDPGLRSRILAELIEQGSVKDREALLRTKTGKDRFFLMNVLPLELRSKKYHIVTMVDITARKKAEDSLRKAHDEMELRVAERTAELAAMNEENRRLAAALASAADGAVICCPDTGVIEYANDAFERITGYGRDELIGKTLDVLTGGVQEKKFFHEIRSVLDRDGLWQGRLTSRRKDGTIFHEDRTCSPVRDPSGMIVNIITFIRDVTDRLKLEAVAASASQLDNIGAVFAGVRHEIGNPINNAKIMLSVLQQKIDALPRDRVREYVGKLLEEISRVEHLLHTLKTFRLFEAPTIEVLDADRLMGLFRDLIGEYLRQRGIAHSTKVLPGAERIRCDQRALQHVLLNLVNNAADALTDREDPRIDITLSRESDRVRIQVSDNGHGMTAEQMANLFTPFHTTKENGTGLGLVIVKKMLTAMDGAIEITSRHGEGTEATIELPGA